MLDNCEHLLDACAVLAGALLRACPGLRILATSRQVLGVPGEVTFPVPPLSVPREGLPVSESPLEYEAVRLRPDADRRLDGGLRAQRLTTVPAEDT